jgi:hypothetical protein
MAAVAEVRERQVTCRPQLLVNEKGLFFQAQVLLLLPALRK